MFGHLYSLSGLPLRLSPLTAKITVSSYGVKLQEVLSGLEEKTKTLDIHVHCCGFSQYPVIHSTWGITIPISLFMGSLPLQTVVNMWQHFFFFLKSVLKVM